MKQIKSFFVTLLLGLAYMLGCTSNIEEVPSYYNDIVNSKWEWKSFEGSEIIRLYFRTDGTLSINTIGLDTVSSEYYYEIIRDVLTIKDRYMNHTYKMKIYSVTTLQLLLTGEWPYPLMFNKQSKYTC